MLASHALSEIEVIESQPPICTDAYDHGMLASTVCEGLRPTLKTVRASKEKPEGFRCVRGSLLAFGLEAAVAFCAYGIWRVWHLLH
jgi:hypothetical protein